VSDVNGPGIPMLEDIRRDRVYSGRKINGRPEQFGLGVDFAPIFLCSGIDVENVAPAEPPFRLAHDNMLLYEASIINGAIHPNDPPKSVTHEEVAWLESRSEEDLIIRVLVRDRSQHTTDQMPMYCYFDAASVAGDRQDGSSVPGWRGGWLDWVSERMIRKIESAPSEPGEITIDMLRDTMDDRVNWALRMINVINSRSVRIENATLDRHTASRVRREVIPKIEYKVIVLPDGTRSTRPSAGRDRSSASRPIPLHTVRGHFATYGPDHPMFGRHVGTFWRPPAVRGSRKYGEITHDYRLEE
jgi:hypothetical protein